MLPPHIVKISPPVSRLDQHGVFVLAAHGAFGRGHFLDLLSAFASPMVLAARHDATELGYVDRWPRSSRGMVRRRDAVTLDVTANRCYRAGMIVSFRDKRTREFAEGRYVKAFSCISRQTEMKLDQLDAATAVLDLAVLPGNRLETLKGDRKGQYNIRINDQWRLCFEWPSGSPGPVNVEIVDYHR